MKRDVSADARRLKHIWHGMKYRCYAKSSTARTLKYYRDKGIVVCEEWHDFNAFYEWAMSHGYEDGLSIDRIDSDGNYCPENCRWISLSQNQSNARRDDTKQRRYRGIRALRLASGKSISDVAQYMGVRNATVSSWDLGSAIPSTDKLLNLANFLGCSAHDICAEFHESAVKHQPHSKEISFMSREKAGYRDNLERLNEMFPDRELLMIKDVMAFCGISRNTAKKWFKYNPVTKRISKADLARAVSG